MIMLRVEVLYAGGGGVEKDGEGLLKFSFMQSHYLLFFYTVAIT